MTHSENARQKETKLTNVRASAIAKKGHAEQVIERLEKLEEQCQQECGISLSDVKKKLEELKKQIEEYSLEIESEVNEIEQELASIKC
jgi:uncharacterized coiled-coil DUF342 family protein